MIKFFTIFFLSFFDYFYKRKLIKFLKKKNIILDHIIDVGAHHGETLNLFFKYFSPKKIYSFEASPKNFIKLKKFVDKLEEKHRKKIKIENIALGKNDRIEIFNQAYESSSSTFNKINVESQYFTRKKLFLGLNKKTDYLKKIEIKITTLDNYFKKNNLEKIDLLKIDTEGFEYEILIGVKNNLDKINHILFEHHYDDMIKKEYKFADINNFLIQNRFKLIFKAKMPFRKSFEYIYGKEK